MSSRKSASTEQLEDDAQSLLQQTLLPLKLLGEHPRGVT